MKTDVLTTKAAKSTKEWNRIPFVTFVFFVVNRVGMESAS